MIEKEYKYLIDEKSFMEFKNKINFDKCNTIINYYYTDSNGILNRNNITVRYREQNAKNTWEIKYPLKTNEMNTADRDSHLAIRKEFSKYGDKKHPITTEEIMSITGCNILDLVEQGCLKTIRYTKYLDENNILYLDINYYLGLIDYEIELEYKSDNPDSKIFLELQKVSKLESIGGKRTRFLRKLQGKY